MLFQPHPASPAKLIPLRALLLKRKENSFRPIRWRLPARCVAAAHGGFWNLDQSPFRGVELYVLLFGTTLPLRTESPGAKHCSPGTLLHFSLQGSLFNFFFYHLDLHWRLLHTGPRPVLLRNRHALLLGAAANLLRRPGIGGTLERHPFSGLLHSAGES